jgi:hypothetical protein
MNRCALAFGLLVVAAIANADRYGPSFAPPGASPPELGAYACVVHRTAGIQGDSKTGERFSGAIKLPTEQAAFTLTLKKRSDGLAGSSYCAEAKPHDPEPDFYKPGKASTTGMRYYSDIDYWFTCKAAYELQLSPSKVVAALRGDDPYTFTDEGHWHIFHLFGSGRFMYTYDDAAGNWYMEEGQCQKI